MSEALQAPPVQAGVSNDEAAGATRRLFYLFGLVKSVGLRLINVGSARSQFGPLQPSCAISSARPVSLDAALDALVDWVAWQLPPAQATVVLSVLAARWPSSQANAPGSVKAEIAAASRSFFMDLSSLEVEGSLHRSTRA